MSWQRAGRWRKSCARGFDFESNVQVRRTNFVVYGKLIIRCNLHIHITLTVGGYVDQEQKRESATFIWRITSIHTIAYFIAGIFALLFANYKEHFASETMSAIMRPVDSPWVALGPSLQLVRGIIIAFVLLPFIKIITQKNGWWKLMCLIVGLSYISTIGPTFGSFEGYIYTKIPLQYHLLGIPEALVYVSLFTFLLCAWYAKPLKAWNIVSVILLVLIVIMSFLGYLSSIGFMKQ